MSERITLCVLFGGHSSEYEVSLSSAYSVLTNLNAGRYDVMPVGITKEGAWYLYTGDWEKIRDGSWCQSPAQLPKVTVDLTPGARSLLICPPGELPYSRKVDVVFPVLHGAYGEDGTVQGMLALADIPFIGCGCTASGVCMDKSLTKFPVAAAGIRQAKYVLARSTDDKKTIAENAERALGYPMFVKPARAGSSVGISKAKDRAGLLTALDVAFREDEKVLIEETIVGREIEVAVLEEHGRYTVSDCAEIDAGAEFYDYDAKYVSDTSTFYIPARLPEKIRYEVRRQAEIIFRALDCRTLSRVDFFVSDNGEIVFNEINTLPGFTSISMYPKLMMHAGMTYGELIDRLVDAVR